MPSRSHICGVSVRWTIADHTRGESVETIARQILTSALSRFALVGFSLGGYIAFEILRQAREHVVRLALLDTGARADSPEQIVRRRERIAMVKAGRFSESLDLQFPIVVHPSARRDEGLRRLYHLMATECGAEALVRHLRASISRPESRPDLAGIRCPTIVVVGDNDQLTPRELAEEIATSITGAQLVVVPGSGHLSPLERPEVVTQALVALLESRGD
jgi:pimeloyl-ACP methyl ester carboxylesterase